MRNVLFVVVLMLVALFAGGAWAQEFEVGGVLRLDEEDTVFSPEDFRGMATVMGISLPKLPADAGAMVELGYYDGGLVYAVWQINRVRIGKVITGADIRIYGGGPLEDDGWDVDERVVAGYQILPKLSVLVSFLEDDRPVSAAVAYRF